MITWKIDHMNLQLVLSLAFIVCLAKLIHVDHLMLYSYFHYSHPHALLSPGFLSRKSHIIRYHCRIFKPKVLLRSPFSVYLYTLYFNHSFSFLFHAHHISDSCFGWAQASSAIRSLQRFKSCEYCSANLPKVVKLLFFQSCFCGLSVFNIFILVPLIQVVYSLLNVALMISSLMVSCQARMPDCVRVVFRVSVISFVCHVNIELIWWTH